MSKPSAGGFTADVLESVSFVAQAQTAIENTIGSNTFLNFI
jgi:hypothetical protein